MQEISPGLWYWTARREEIGSDVSSYYLAEERVLLDPMIPAEGIAWFEEHGAPEHVLLTNRHHDRDSWRLRERFGCTVHCVRNGMYELEGRGTAEPFDFGDELPGGVIVHEIDAICPDETALHIPAHGALACADGVIHYGAELGFVPERYMDDPERTKRELRAARGCSTSISKRCSSPTGLRGWGAPTTHSAASRPRSDTRSGGTVYPRRGGVLEAQTDFDWR